MIEFRTLALAVTMIVVNGSGSVALYAQAATPPIQTPSMTITLSLEKTHFLAGEKPHATVHMKNISDHEVDFSTSSALFRVHIEGKDGGPTETEWQRHRHGDFRPGDGPELMDGPVISRPIEPGATDYQTYDLTMFYDLSVPGKYIVSIEIYDPSGPQDESGLWLRTNSAKFEMEAKAQ
ncbi:MAG: hypothetical protein WCA11_19380 [Terracidiphilus sp.]